MPLTNASPHFCTDVVFLSGPGSPVEHLAERGEVGLALLHQRRVDPQHVRGTDVDAEVGDLQPQHVGEVLDPRLGRLYDDAPGNGA